LPISIPKAFPPIKGRGTCRAELAPQQKEAIMKVLIITAVFALVAGAASAQQLRIFGTLDRGYTVQTPGQLPTYVTPNPGGGYTFQTPGQLPTYATPNVSGGYTLQQRGRPPTYMHPQ
jgi:hypothetical protein